MRLTELDPLLLKYIPNETIARDLTQGYINEWKDLERIQHLIHFYREHLDELQRPRIPKDYYIGNFCSQHKHKYKCPPGCSYSLLRSNSLESWYYSIEADNPTYVSECKKWPVTLSETNSLFQSSGNPQVLYQLVEQHINLLLSKCMNHSEDYRQDISTDFLQVAMKDYPLIHETIKDIQLTKLLFLKNKLPQHQSQSFSRYKYFVNNMTVLFTLFNNVLDYEWIQMYRPVSFILHPEDYSSYVKQHTSGGGGKNIVLTDELYMSLLAFMSEEYRKIIHIEELYQERRREEEAKIEEEQRLIREEKKRQREAQEEQEKVKRRKVDRDFFIRMGWELPKYLKDAPPPDDMVNFSITPEATND